MTRLFIAVAFLAAVACGSSSSPTAPTAPVVPPAATTYALSGQVTSAASGAPIANATITIADGPNAGKVAHADGNGTYAFAALTVSGFTVGFMAANYVSTAKPVTLTSNQVLNAQLQPTPLFVQTGVGNFVLTLPAGVSRLHITGTYGGATSNFIVWAGPPNAACGSGIIAGCSLVVNDLIGTAWGKTISDGVYNVPAGTTIDIIDSSGVAWSFTEVRP